MESKQPCVYMLASRRNGTIYLGVTSDIVKRAYQHRSDVTQGFSKKYKVHDSVWYELHTGMVSAILREKQIKKWSRAAKIRLIETGNATWQDLWPALA
jgi:putative endonuclease